MSTISLFISLISDGLQVGESPPSLPPTHTMTPPNPPPTNPLSSASLHLPSLLL